MTSLSYEAYVPMAMSEISKVRKEAIVRFGLTGCAIHHRTGHVPVGEAAVVVACSSAHRSEAFQALAWIMDVIKERVPIWKREAYQEGGEAWVEKDGRMERS